MAMAKTNPLISIIDRKLDVTQLPRAALGRDVLGLPGHRGREPGGRAQRLPARVRHDPVVRLRDVHAVQAGVHPLPLLRRPDRQRRRRDLRPRAAADAARRFLQVRRAGLRHREAHPAAARPGRLEQEHDRPAAEEGPGDLLARPTPGKCYTYSLAAAAARRRRRRRRAVPRLPDARGAAAADPARGAAGSARVDQREAARGPARSGCTATSARSAARSTPT